LRCLETAKALGLKRIGLTGNDGGKLRDLADMCVMVPSSSTPRIQEAHTLVIHILCGIVENAFVHDAHPGGQIFIGGKAR
jgi:D-sedoheptulose 7-phosphate isomerase